MYSPTAPGAMATAWDRMAAWRDSASGERGDLWHRALIDPTLLRVVGPVRRLRVLDLACGNGYLARSFAARGASSVVAVDASAATLRFALRREKRRPRGVVYRRADASALPFPRASFDLVVANMALMDIADAHGAVREAARVLAPGGRFVFSISHPCFDVDLESVWLLERGFEAGVGYRTAVYRKVRGYRRERSTLVPWILGGGKVVRTRSYHRTLATYVRYLREAGLVLVRMEEPLPEAEMLRESPQGAFIAEIPLHLVVEAVPGPGLREASRTTERSLPAAARRSGSRGRRPGTGSPGRGSRSGS